MVHRSHRGMVIRKFRVYFEVRNQDVVIVAVKFPGSPEECAPPVIASVSPHNRRLRQTGRKFTETGSK